ncbi:ABC transporter permease [Actinoplanes sp. NPDC020271]|uniref:ABC transporter permease n=1 Tax=Actinoplanes sp. NPDC020271 TaxID=3363896 RepID=UPI0037ABB408
MTKVPLPDPARLRGTDLVNVGLDGLRGRPMRAALSAIGIAIGVAAMVGLVGVSTVSKAGLMAQIKQLGTDMLTVSAGATLTGQTAVLPETAEGMVTRIPGVAKVSAVGAVTNATVRRTDHIEPTNTNGIAVQAARTDLLESLSGSMQSGVFLNAATSKYPAVVLGSVAAKRLGIDQAGSHVYIAGRYLLVVGITNGLPLAPEIERSALLGWSYATELGFDGHATSLYERSTEGSVQSVRNVIRETVNPEHPEEVQVSRPSDALTAEAAANNAFNALFFGLGAVALLAGGVGVANIMVISVLERRQEIGLRRSLGATRGQIRMQFLTESVTLSALGGTAGVLLGLVGCMVFAAVKGWPLALPAQAIIGGAVASVLIGAVAGVYPARRAARLTPSEALATI